MLRQEAKRAEIWLGAMLPNLKDPPSFDAFVKGTSDNRSEIARCLEQWDRVEAALNANKRAVA